MAKIAWITHPPPIETQKQQDRLIAARRSLFYVRYGDWTSTEWGRLRKARQEVESAKVLSVADAITLSDEPLEEDAEWRHGLLPRTAEKTPASFAVSQACKAIGLDMTQTIIAVHVYARQSRPVETEWARLLPIEHYDMLKYMIYDDLRDLPNCLHAGLQGEFEYFKVYLEEMADRWWYRTLSTLNNSRAWASNYETIRTDAEAQKRIMARTEDSLNGERELLMTLYATANGEGQRKQEEGLRHENQAEQESATANALRASRIVA